jgi:type IV fimbrial biogenesis protein FimT
MNRIRRRGLTLVELAVAMALLATLLTAGYPHLADWIARKRVQSAAETLQADLSDARLLAAQRGQSMHLAFVAGTEWCWAIATAATCDCRVQQACRLKGARAASHRGVWLAAASDASFTPEGLGQGSAELRSLRGHVLRVEVGTLGRSRICQPGGGDPRHPAC